MFQTLASRITGTPESRIWLGDNDIKNDNIFEWKPAGNERP